MRVEALRNISTHICQYFLEFLESDFRKKQAPRRRVILKSEEGFTAGLQIAPYPKLQESLIALLKAKLSTQLELKIEPKKFIRTISVALEKVIHEQVRQLDQGRIDAVIAETCSYVDKSRVVALTKPEQWIEDVVEHLRHQVSSQLVRPILALLDDSLSKYSASQSDSLFNSENDLVSLFVGPLNEGLTEILAKQIGKESTDELQTYLSDSFSQEKITSEFANYFKSFVAADVFLECRDIENYATTVEGMQIYLYLGTLRFGHTMYPLFYIPVDVIISDDKRGYRLTISNHLYANRRAIDYVLQEVATRQQRQWTSPISERINYLNTDSSISEIVDPLMNRIQQAFGLTGDLSFDGLAVKQYSDSQVSISNAMHLCVFDNADEALLNDYEEMILLAQTDGEGVISLFDDIVAGVLTSNPTSISPQISKEWDDLELLDRVLPETPLPLNEEQIKILKAINHESGKFIVVEGPPGTGKSHTIVAIAADCAFNEKSCLILSDKKEALEVVYDKLSKTMNEVRGKEEFPNPLLKIGTDQQNFRKLVSTQVITELQTQVKALKSNSERVAEEKAQKRQSLKESLDTLSETLGKVDVLAIKNCEIIRSRLTPILGEDLIQEIEVASKGITGTLAVDIHDQLADQFQSLLAQIFRSRPPQSLNDLKSEIATLLFGIDFRGKNSVPKDLICKELKAESIEALSRSLMEFRRLKQPIFGYLFRGGRLTDISQRIQSSFKAAKQIDIKRDWQAIEDVLTLARSLDAALGVANNDQLEFEKVFSSLQIDGLEESLLNRLQQTVSLLEDCGQFEAVAFGDRATQEVLSLIALVSIYMLIFKSVCKHFDQAPTIDYVKQKQQYERLNTSLMNFKVDTRLTRFAEESRADAKVLAKLIKDKQKFPEAKFDKVKEAFPVIIASIREFGEYMPLLKDMFDVLVIDEASQVSVAQAFPAMLRAKKVVVMGDSKQFSNTKSLNASVKLNDEHRGRLEAEFKRHVSNEAEALQRLSYFDVKKSVLEFAQLCSNYTILLRKHFRSYQELIGFSSKHFYGGQLQAIKIRSKPLDEVIKFSVIEQTDPIGDKKNTNLAEASFILARLLELVAQPHPPTVGVITPFREQQTLISRLVANHSGFEDFRKSLSLKIMTFDSCQGEERTLIFYSMVASRESDNLNYIFPTSLEQVDELVDTKLKIQRLNVGFSRAQECIWFVLSKNLDEYKGGIGQTLRHYNNILNKKLDVQGLTDPNSPMEEKVLNWILATDFYQNNSESIELIPQFPIGDYLSQLDPYYKHPSWRVDFLLTVKTATGLIQVVIEYDGFEYHFKADADIDEGNYHRYMTEQDIERQLTLESYGYRFLRLNRFNLGRDPVGTISQRLRKLAGTIDSSAPTESSVVDDLQRQAASLATKESKVCGKCNEIKSLQDFYDPTLRSGLGAHGRICMQCKGRT